MDNPTIVNPTANIILIVEDETFIADIYAREFTKAGYRVKIASDGQTGLKIMTEEKFDLLLLDIMLPGMHGLEVLRQWRIKNPTSTMPILLLTNLGQDEVIKEAFNLGAQGYLIKSSYTPQQVVQEVRNALSGQASKTPPPAA